MIPRGRLGIAAAVAISAAASALAANPAVADEHRYALIVWIQCPSDRRRQRSGDRVALCRRRRVRLLQVPPRARRSRHLAGVAGCGHAATLSRPCDQAAPPTIAALDEAVARLAADIQADARAGRTSVFSFFYSGHGTRDGDGGGALALADGALSRRMLYERILDRVTADVVHLYVDACHAEAIVRPRDSDAAAVAVSSEDVTTYISQSTLARYPRVGAAIASSRDAAAHEWDQYHPACSHRAAVGLAWRGGHQRRSAGRIQRAGCVPGRRQPRGEGSRGHACRQSCARRQPRCTHRSSISRRRAPMAV